MDRILSITGRNMTCMNRTRIGTVIVFCLMITLFNSYFNVQRFKPKIQQPCTISKQVPFKLSISLISWYSLKKEIKDVRLGGYYKPQHCISTQKVAIIVPYRDREAHLRVFLRNLHRFLQQQNLDYGIFVIEMTDKFKFNRGLLMNVGFYHSSRLNDGYDCFIFHDVDLIPEKIGNVYNCSRSPRHLATAIDVRHYKLSTKTYFGGVCAFTKDQFTRVNGFSNHYFGWGKEDDDLYWRVSNSNMHVLRQHNEVGRYTTLRHQHAVIEKNNVGLFKRRNTRQSSDGLNNLTYHMIAMELRPLFTWILIECV